MELLGPAWYAVWAEYGNAALEFLARYADPHAVIRLGRARLARFLTPLAWRLARTMPRGLIAAANETLALWLVDGRGMNFPNWPPTSPTRPTKRCI